MPIITPNYNHRLSGREYDLEQASDTPKLDLMKDAMGSVQSYARDYTDRNTTAEDWWYARWPGQTCDGRRWALDDNIDAVWPWPGASDSRIRFCEKLVREASLLGNHALMNQKVQAISSQPLASQRESQQMTTLMNWMLFSHMAVDLHLEQKLMLANRHGLGSAVTELCWEQERRLEYVPVSLMSLDVFVKRVGTALVSEDGGSRIENGGRRQTDREMALGFMMELAKTRSPLLELQSMILDVAYEDDLVRIVQAMSPIVTKRQASSILKDLRELRTAEIPVPEVFKSQPKRTTLRPMIDVFFPRETGNLQRARWIARSERVDGPTLKDRIETAEYDPGFVEDALANRGPSKTGGFGSAVAKAMADGPIIIGPGGRNVTGSRDDLDDDIELVHFHMLVQDRGVPILFSTTFHMDLDTAAVHGPSEYDHGQHQFHGHRFETDARDLLSSRGLPEIAYTWEQEIKKQRDGRTDAVDMRQRPVIFTTYEAMQKMKSGYEPGAFIPMRKFDEVKRDNPPPFDQGSIEIEKAVERTAQDYFGWFGNDVDPMKKQLSVQLLADDILAEEKPIHMQMGELLPQYLPDAKVASVVGPLSRPFQINRADIQGRKFEMIVTVDMRDQNAEWLEKKAKGFAQIKSLDTQGVVDDVPVVTSLLEAWDYQLADTAIRSREQASEGEVQDEKTAFSLMIGSGRDQPLPQGGNYQLRMTTLQNQLQEAMQSDPDFPKRIEMFPGIMKVLQTRMQFFQRQLQQKQNAQIGRTQVGETFTGKAPALAEVGGLLGVKNARSNVADERPAPARGD